MRQSILICIVALALLALFVADARAVTMAWSPVGNPANAADPATGSLYGAVAYNYNIAKYDVTVGQYTEFLNAVAALDPYGLYNASMATNLNIAGIARSVTSGGYAYSVIGSSVNLPITYVSWGGAARFANWLQNGQPTGSEGTGTTETGAYTLNGVTTDAALNAVTRNAGATIFLPSENEWYKAAYYNPATSSYYQFPTSSNTTTISAPPGSTPNTANFVSFGTGYAVTHSLSLDSNQNYLTAVGAYTASASPYGAFDMGGDVLNWNEALIAGTFRSYLGVSWDTSNLGSSRQYGVLPTYADNVIGFRVASLVPEPSSLVLAALGFIGLCWLRLR